MTGAERGLRKRAHGPGPDTVTGRTIGIENPTISGRSGPKRPGTVLASGGPVTRNDNPLAPQWSHLAGRSEELAGLRRSYRAACEGEIRLLVLDGPSAAGQTAVLDAWLAEHRAGPVLRVDARRTGALEGIVRAALSVLSPVRRARHPAAALLGESRRTGVRDFMVAAERRLRLREEVGRLLSEVGAPNPAVLVLEGAEDADRSTLDVLAHLVRGDAPWTPLTKMLVVAIVDGAPRGALASLARAEGARTLTLRPLDRTGVRAFLSSPDVVDAVLSLTGGLPELIERLVAGQGLHPNEERSNETRDALEALAILGRPATDARLRALLEGALPDGASRDPATLDRATFDGADLARAGAVRGADAWLLPPTLRDRICATIDPSRARALHRAAAELLSEDDPAAAARHALRAGRLAHATELALEGAERLLERHAAVDAADLLLEVAEAHEAPPPALRARLVELLWVAGDHADAIRHATVLADERPDDPSAALRLGRLLAYAGHSSSACARLEQAIASASEHGADRAILLEAKAALADARYAAGELDAAEMIARDVADSAHVTQSALVDPGLVLDAQNTLAKIEIASGRVDDASARLRASLAEAETRSLPRQACQALNNLAIVAMGRGELSQAERCLERMVELADAHGAVFFRGIAHKNLAVVQQLEGSWEAALHHSERALALLSGLGHASLIARLSFNTADLHRTLGDPYRALRLCAHARERAADALEPAVDCEGLRVEAAVHAELGHGPEARRAWERALEIAETLGLRGPATDAMLGLAALDLDEGEPANAVARVSEIGETSDRRAAARLALLLASTAAMGDRIPRARFAVQAAARTNDPLMEQPARLELARALTDAGLGARASEELAELRRREGELALRVPEALRPLFSERRFARQLAAAERGLLENGLVEHEAGREAGTSPLPNGARAMVGTSAPMRELRSFIERVGPTHSAVLITGESGTGKELVAEALHAASARRDAPFVRVNCAALVDELLSSELFGHERGAFTGADRQKKGRFELADGGTLLLDEIGDVSPRMQASLLRVLQERSFERVGGTKTLAVNVRVIAATHRDLAALVAEGRFREDLYYRLRGITVHVPSLRERRDDLPELARHLLSKMIKDSGGEPKTLAPDALSALARHDWPGNIRELENTLRSAAVLCASSLVTSADLEELAPRVSGATHTSDASLGALAYERVKGGEGSIYELRKSIERELVERALFEAGGNISRAADLLGMKRPRLSKLVHEWGLK